MPRSWHEQPRAQAHRPAPALRRAGQTCKVGLQQQNIKWRGRGGFYAVPSALSPIENPGSRSQSGHRGLLCEGRTCVCVFACASYLKAKQRPTKTSRGRRQDLPNLRIKLSAPPPLNAVLRRFAAQAAAPSRNFCMPAAVRHKKRPPCADGHSYSIIAEIQNLFRRRPPAQTHHPALRRGQVSWLPFILRRAFSVPKDQWQCGFVAVTVAGPCRILTGFPKSAGQIIHR